MKIISKHHRGTLMFLAHFMADVDTAEWFHCKWVDDSRHAKVLTEEQAKAVSTFLANCHAYSTALIVAHPPR